ncbi:MAG: hypothetical protein JWO98_4945 [Frankiales bacterium]|nr:hypothetical protein [Frankiales bacterium]
MEETEYERWQADLKAMNEAYEAADQAEYVAYMNELDAAEEDPTS